MESSERERLSALLSKLDLSGESETLNEMFDMVVESIISSRLTMQCLLSTLEKKAPWTC